MDKNENVRTKPASQDQITLYCLMGEALCSVQLLEDCLSHLLTLKKDVKRPSLVSKEDAEALLQNYRSYTLGKAIQLVKKESLFTQKLEKDLEKILLERNWFVHRCLHESLDGSSDKMSFGHCKNQLFKRIKNITNQAQILQHLIEKDLLSFSEEIGIDMSNVRRAQEEYYRY